MPLPESFLSRMQNRLGAEFPAFLQAMHEPPPVSLRLHPFKKGSRFQQNERVPWHPEGRYLPERPSFTLDPAFQAGAYYVQEASSMFLFEALRQTVDLNKNLRVLDLCAAPGGKSTLLLSAISSGSFLLANEVIHSRIPALRANLEKWGYPNVMVSNHDPADFQPLAGFFDVVVVDAPCSGEGLFRKDESAAGEWSENNAELCAARQRRILAEARQLVRPGGVLIYSTCTFNVFENENNVNWLLDEGGFEEIRLQTDPAYGIVEARPGYQFFPHRLKGEGFFIACLRKSSTEPEQRFKPSGLQDWQRLGQKERPACSDWLREPEQHDFFTKPNGEIVAIPQNLAEDFGIIARVLKKRSLGGVMIGELKKRDFVPSHAFALSSLVSSSLPAADLDLNQSIAFLKKENPGLAELEKGWTLARFEGLNLGWMKVLDNRINNYLPNEWRIRMG